MPTADLAEHAMTVIGGEVLGLVGENGAGKSTPMKILFGMNEIRDTGGYVGDVLLSGSKVNFDSPFNALPAEIALIFTSDWQIWDIPGIVLADIGMVICLQNMGDGLPQEAWMSEFIPAPLVEEEDEGITIDEFDMSVEEDLRAFLYAILRRPGNPSSFQGAVSLL